MNRQRLRKETYALETVDPKLRERFENEIQRVVHEPLKPWERILALVLLPVMVGVSIFCGRLWLIAPTEYSSFVRTEIGIVSVVCVLLAGLLVLEVKKRRHPRNGLAMAGAAFGAFVAIVAVSIIMAGSVEPDLLAAVVVVGFVLICERIKTAELRIRESVLKQELRVIQFAEHLGRVIPERQEESRS